MIINILVFKDFSGSITGAADTRYINVTSDSFRTITLVKPWDTDIHNIIENEDLFLAENATSYSCKY